MIRRDGDVLAVDDPADNVTYIIEPARYDLGLTRVAMVDRHLVDLAGRSGPAADLFDVLLDARVAFQAEVPR